MPIITLKVGASSDDARSLSNGTGYNDTGTTMFLGKYTDGNNYINGFRFTNVTIPQGATIVSATIDLYIYEKTGTTLNTIWKAQAIDNAPTFANTTDATTGRPNYRVTTTASNTHSTALSGVGITGFGNYIVSVANAVQEVVNRAGWVSGNSLVLIGQDNGSSGVTYVGQSTYNRDTTRGATLTIEYTTASIPDAPLSLTVGEITGKARLNWDDNSTNESGFILERKRGGSPNFYQIATLPADTTTYTDSGVDAGYTYTYRIKATSADGDSPYTTSQSITMSGTRTWTARSMAWIYPGAPADDADEEYRDGRTIHVLKPEYYIVNASGVLQQLVAPNDGENAYSTANVADIKNYSDEQYCTIASNHVNMAALLSDPTKRTNAINTLVSFCTSSGFTGVELDWEGFADWTAADYANYKAFIADLGTALHDNGHKLMVDGPPITNGTEQSYYLWKYDEIAAISQVDKICMMLYDYQYDYGVGSSVQPAVWARNGAKWMRDNVGDVDRIAIGIPSYGYHGVTGSYSVTIDTKQQSSAFTGFNTATRNADNEMTWTSGGSTYVYQDSAGLSTKRERIEDEGIKWVTTWHLGGNDWYTAFSEMPRSTPPNVDVSSVYNVTQNTADLDAEVISDGGASVTERGIVYATTAYPTTADNKATSGTGTGKFTVTLTGLSVTTTYYARAYAINSEGTSYSSQIAFTTTQTSSVPAVTTGTPLNITDSTAVLKESQVVSDGTKTVTERGIVFSDTNSSPNTEDRIVTAPASGLGSYDLSMTGLSPETTYYVRAYAINSLGTGYGEVKTFTTQSPPAPDEGDGYWTWNPSGSNAVVGRLQSTPANASANLMLADLNLDNGASYTLYYASKENATGETKMVLQWYESGVKAQQVINAGTPYTFTYDTTKTDWAIRLFVTGDSVVADNITATFSDMYLAKEAEFSGFVPFEANGITEIKVENNWLVDKQRSEVISTMFDAMKGTSWYPFTIETEGLGWFEIGDRFTITDSQNNSRSVVVWNSKLTIDGGIKETLHTEVPDLTETDYSRAGKLGGLWKRTQITVNKNTQDINSLVEDIYNFDGVINTKFSEIQQDVNEVRTTVQGSGGVNLIRNSVMYAFDAEGNPDSWTVTGAGSLVIQASNESLSNGAVSGNQFTLSNKTATQTVTVRKDVDFIAEDDKTYYSLSARVKKNTVGAAWIKLINRNETLRIDLPDQTSYFWDIVKLEELLPLDDHYDIEIYSDADADLQVTDLILAPGKTRREWSQANGEMMNASVSITKDGITVRSSAFQKNFTSIDALGFEVHKQDVGGDRVFGFNDDETNVSKLKADKQITMPPLRTVPINYGSYKGWAFTIAEEN